MYYKEFQISLKSKIFTYCVAIVFIAISGWFSLTNQTKVDLSDLTSLLEPTIYFATISLMMYSLVYVHKTKIIITDNSIIKIGLFKTTELYIDEIEGFSYNNSIYTIVSDNGTKRQVMQFSNSFADFAEIEDWLYTNSTNSDIKEEKEDRKQALRDELYGENKKERRAKLKKYKNYAKYINWTGIFIGVYIVFFTKPYEYSIWAGIIFPFIVILILNVDKHFKLELNLNEYYPDLTHAFMFSILFLFVEILHYDIYSYSNLWKLLVPLSLIIFTLIYLNKLRYGLSYFKNNDQMLKALSILFFVVIYSYSIIIFLNCYYDNSDSLIFKTKVLNKVESGRTKSRKSLNIEKWENEKNIKSISVSKSLFNRVKVGDTVIVTLYKGNLNIPWYDLTD